MSMDIGFHFDCVFSYTGEGNTLVRMTLLVHLFLVSGAPKEYLKIERLNDRLQSYSYSLQKVCSGRVSSLSNTSSGHPDGVCTQRVEL